MRVLVRTRSEKRPSNPYALLLFKPKPRAYHLHLVALVHGALRGRLEGFGADLGGGGKVGSSARVGEQTMRAGASRSGWPLAGCLCG